MYRIQIYLVQNMVILKKIKVRNDYVIYACLLVVLLVHGIYVALRGPLMSPDSRLYSAWADILIGYNYNFISYINNTEFSLPPIMYLGFVTLVSLSKSLFGESWQHAIVFINVFLHIFSIYLALNILNRVTSSVFVILAATILFLSSFETILWLPFVLSDISFMAISFIILCLTWFYVTANKRNNEFLVSVILLLPVLITYRPAALPIVLVVLVLHVLSFFELDEKFSRARIGREILYSGIVILTIGVLLVSYLMQDTTRWPFQVFSHYLATLSELYAKGCVIDDRPDTFLAPPVVFFDYVFLILTRIIYFFAFAIDEFSLKHKFINYFFFVPAYVLAVIGALELFKGKSILTLSGWYLGMMSFLAIIFIAVYNSFLLIDFDWRYRLTLMPPLVVLAGLGVFKITKCFKN